MAVKNKIMRKTQEENGKFKCKFVYRKLSATNLKNINNPNT